MVLVMVFMSIHSMDWMWEFMRVCVMVCGMVAAMDRQEEFATECAIAFAKVPTMGWMYGSAMFLTMTPMKVPLEDQMLDCAKPQVMVSARDPRNFAEAIILVFQPVPVIEEK